MHEDFLRFSEGNHWVKDYENGRLLMQINKLLCKNPPARVHSLEMSSLSITNFYHLIR